MTGNRDRRALPLLIALALAACNRSEPRDNASANITGMTAEQADDALDNALNASEGGVPANAIGTLVPPAPGEEGGLPDDRRPLDEGAARNPSSVAASGSTIERWGLALSEGRYGEAYRFWHEGGRASGMSAAQFADAYRQYAEIHVLVGRPEAGDTETARVPVQMYGRLKAGGEPFNLFGMMTLKRNPRGQNGETGQLPWLIVRSELKPRGVTRIAPPGAEPPAQGGSDNRLPVAFQGLWAASKAACDRGGDDSRLTVNPDLLIFYESQGRVRSVERISPAQIRVSASYEGEGESWSRTSRLTLSQTQDMLTVDGMKRVRCPR